MLKKKQLASKDHFDNWLNTMVRTNIASGVNIVQTHVQGTLSDVPDHEGNAEEGCRTVTDVNCYTIAKPEFWSGEADRAETEQNSADVTNAVRAEHGAFRYAIASRLAKSSSSVSGNAETA
ncbi:MAG: hypothetical protein HOA17_03115 [Candidatus Melainabacteria bacterium]|nr:hypothetical protein [Candidatus Melainabacteria bacterium]